MSNRVRPLTAAPRKAETLREVLAGAKGDRDILDEMQAGESVDRWAMEHDSHDLAQSSPDRPAPLYTRKPPR